MTRFIAWLCKPRIVLALPIVLAFTIVVQTYSTFSHTWDEPAHLATGLELLDLGTYYYEHQHPPLARVAMAFGPYLDGQRSGRANVQPRTDFWERMIQGFDEGRRILYQVGPYERVLTLARIGILPFLLIALLATYGWARNILGEWPAVLAVFLLVTVPPFLGNAGIATLDIPVAGMGIASLFAFCLWLERPRPSTALVFGALAGGAIMAKFSAIPFLGVSFAAIFAWRTWIEWKQRAPVFGRAHVKSGLIALAVMLFVFWLCYGFGLASLVDPANRPYEAIEQLFGRGSALSNFVSDAAETAIPIFIPEIRQGIEDVRYHNAVGHLSYLLGEVRSDGWKHYYLVALGVRTPLPLLIVGLIGMGLMLRASVRDRDWRIAAPTLAFLAILGFAITYSRINIGVRHLLILYPLLAIGAAYAMLCLMRTVKTKPWALATLAALVAAQAASLIITHPNHLTYFNAIVGAHPEHFLISADLDWGQDLWQLEKELEKRGIDRVAVTYYGSADLTKHKLPGYTPLKPNTPQTGWIVASLWRLRRNEDYSWLRAYEPVARVGTSINLYYIDKLK